MEMNFNGFTVSQLFGITDVDIKVLPDVEVTSKKIPSRHGTIFQGATIGEREITVSIYLIKEYIHQFTEEGIPTASVYQNFIRSIVFYLQTDEPKPLIFSDEPDRYYNAICTSIDIQRLFKLGTGTITFICNDPYLYATDEKIFFKGGNGKFLIDNCGTAPTYPRVTINCMKDMNYLAVITPESVVQIGTVGDEQSETKKITKYKDAIKTLNNWSYGSQATMMSDTQYDSEITVTGTGEVMKPALTRYGEGDIITPYKQKGTQMITTLQSQYRSKYFDTRLQFDFHAGDANTRKPAQMGVLHIHLLDTNNNVIAVCGMYDWNRNIECNIPFVRLGATNTVWKDQAQTPTPTTKTYSKVLENEEDLPADATLVSKFERQKGYEMVALNDNSVPVYNTASTSKLKTTIKNKMGAKYRLKSESENGNWYCIYLNSACTSSGWVYKTQATKQGDESETVYTYTRKIYPDKNIGKYCDFWGYFKIARKPHGNGKGDIWELSLYRLQTVNGVEKTTKLMSKKITDASGTKYTHAGAIAKVAVTFGCCSTYEPITRMSFNHLEVEAYPTTKIDNEPHLIASAGDTITIDYAIPEVLLNGENLMHEVDIGSRFEPIQPFMRTELEISSDGTYEADVAIRERFL